MIPSPILVVDNRSWSVSSERSKGSGEGPIGGGKRILRKSEGYGGWGVSDWDYAGRKAYGNKSAGTSKYIEGRSMMASRSDFPPRARWNTLGSYGGRKDRGGRSVPAGMLSLLNSWGPHHTYFVPTGH